MGESSILGVVYFFALLNNKYKHLLVFPGIPAGFHVDSWCPHGFLVNSLGAVLAGLFLVDSTWIPPGKIPGSPQEIYTPAVNPVGLEIMKLAGNLRN